MPTLSWRHAEAGPPHEGLARGFLAENYQTDVGKLLPRMSLCGFDDIGKSTQGGSRIRHQPARHVRCKGRASTEAAPKRGGAPICATARQTLEHDRSADRVCGRRKPHSSSRFRGAFMACAGRAIAVMPIRRRGPASMAALDHDRFTSRRPPRKVAGARRSSFVTACSRPRHPATLTVRDANDPRPSLGRADYSIFASARLGRAVGFGRPVCAVGLGSVVMPASTLAPPRRLVGEAP